LKLHEEREVEAGLELDEDADDGEGADGSQAREKKRRRVVKWERIGNARLNGAERISSRFALVTFIV